MMPLSISLVFLVVPPDFHREDFFYWPELNCPALKGRAINGISYNSSKHFVSQYYYID